MKLTLIGSHLCKETLYAIIKLRDSNAVIDFQNISASFDALRAFLKYRESSPAFDAAKANGTIGIPFFILEDGTQTHDLKYVLSLANAQ